MRAGRRTTVHTPPAWCAAETERRGSYSGNYSTVNSAQRLSATLSIRPSGRVQIIDM